MNDDAIRMTMSNCNFIYTDNSWWLDWISLQLLAHIDFVKILDCVPAKARLLGNCFDALFPALPANPFGVTFCITVDIG